MAGPSVLSRDYSGIVAAALIKYKKTKTPMDNITSRNSVLYYMVKNGTGYTPVDGGLGERMGVVVRYANQQAEPFGGWDVVNTAAIDGVTHAFWTWAFASAPVSISLEEEEKARGEEEIYDILGTRTEQALDGLYDRVARSLMRGNADNNATDIFTPYTRPSNGRTMFDPLTHIIRLDPTAAATVGNIAQATQTWWRNKFKDFTGLATFAAIKKAMDQLDDDCSKTPSGSTDLMVGGYAMVQLYEALIYSKFSGTDYQRIDIPFGNIAYRGKPFVKDELMVNIKDGTGANEAKGSYFSLNTKRLFLKYSPRYNFDLGTDALRPVDQLGFVRHVIWVGGLGTDERRAHGVGAGVDLAVVS